MAMTPMLIAIPTDAYATAEDGGYEKGYGYGKQTEYEYEFEYEYENRRMLA